MKTIKELKIKEEAMEEYKEWVVKLIDKMNIKKYLYSKDGKFHRYCPRIPQVIEQKIKEELKSKIQG